MKIPQGDIDGVGEVTVTSGHTHREIELGEKVGFIETTAWRQRRNGGREVTVTSRDRKRKD